MKILLIFVGLILLVPINTFFFKNWYSSEEVTEIKKGSVLKKVFYYMPTFLITLFIDVVIISGIYIIGSIAMTTTEYREVVGIDKIEVKEICSLDLIQGGDINGSYNGGGFLSKSTGNLNGEIVPYYYYYIKENGEFKLERVEYSRASIIYIDKVEESRVEKITEKTVKEVRYLRKDPMYGEDTDWEYKKDKEINESVKFYIPPGSIVESYKVNM